MAFFTLQSKVRTLLESNDDVANVVRTHAGTLYPLAWGPTASVVKVVVVACSSKFVVTSAYSSNIDADLLASSVTRSAAAPRHLFD